MKVACSRNKKVKENPQTECPQKCEVLSAECKEMILDNPICDCEAIYAVSSDVEKEVMLMRAGEGCRQKIQTNSSAKLFSLSQ